jgi:hypothetical protein
VSSQKEQPSLQPAPVLQMGLRRIRAPGAVTPPNSHLAHSGVASEGHCDGFEQRSAPLSDAWQAEFEGAHNELEPAQLHHMTQLAGQCPTAL